MTSGFYATVQMHQDEDVTSHLNIKVSMLKNAILCAARRGERQIVLNDFIACASPTERRTIFRAAESIVAEGGFKSNEHYVGKAGSYKNASGDIYVYTISW